MIDMYISWFKECFVQLCEMLRTGQAVLISVNKCLIITLIFGQDIKGYDLQFLDSVVCCGRFADWEMQRRLL